MPEESSEHCHFTRQIALFNKITSAIIGKKIGRPPSCAHVNLNQGCKMYITKLSYECAKDFAIQQNVGMQNSSAHVNLPVQYLSPENDNFCLVTLNSRMYSVRWFLFITMPSGLRLQKRFSLNIFASKSWRYLSCSFTEIVFQFLLPFPSESASVLSWRKAWLSPTLVSPVLLRAPEKLVLMSPTRKRFASKVPTENHNCLSLPTKAGFFEKVPSDERKRLGATHIWN